MKYRIVLESTSSGVKVNDEEFIAVGLYEAERLRANAAERRLEMIRTALDPSVKDVPERDTGLGRPGTDPLIVPTEAPEDQVSATVARSGRSFPLSLIAGAWLLTLGVLIGGVAVPRVQDRPALVETVSAPPATEQPVVQPTGPPQAEARTFSWAPVAGADAYEVSFYEDGGVVATKVVRNPQATFRLQPGHYVWYVWPVREGITDTAAVVSSEHTESG